MTSPLISVCICTFRRRSVCETIESIAHQKLDPEISFEVIVVDNDVEPTARPYVEETAARFPNLELTYVHAPARNISIARNACVENARGEWIAFIDDDEIASDQWLQHHYDGAMQNDLDLSFGPVISIYPDHTPAWIREIDLHSISVGHLQPILTGHTSNAFFKRQHPAIAPLRFSEDRGRSGGEDTQFFYQCFLGGVKIDETREAVVHEPVADNRLSLDWLVKNKFRSGITYGKVIVYKDNLVRNLLKLAASMAKVAYLMGLAALTFWSKATSRRHYIRAVFHSGIIAAFFSVKEAEYYGAPDTIAAK
nr:glycosyltransferase family 2 protein [Hyphomonas sp. Mor2]